MLFLFILPHSLLSSFVSTPSLNMNFPSFCYSLLNFFSSSFLPSSFFSLNLFYLLFSTSSSFLPHPSSFFSLSPHKPHNSLFPSHVLLYLLISLLPLTSLHFSNVSHPYITRLSSLLHPVLPPFHASYCLGLHWNYSSLKDDWLFLSLSLMIGCCHGNSHWRGSV